MYTVRIYYADAPHNTAPAQFTNVTSFDEGEHVLILYLDDQRARVGIVLSRVTAYLIKEAARASQ